MRVRAISDEEHLAFLASQQNEDGSFGSGTVFSHNIAVTALSGMAVVSAGNTPGRGKYGRSVDRALQYILEHVGPNGFITARDTSPHGPMYDHGFATLFLAEVYGMSPTPDLRDKLTLAIKLIINTQNKEGGWRYQPVRGEADISLLRNWWDFLRRCGQIAGSGETGGEIVASNRPR